MLSMYPNPDKPSKRKSGLPTSKEKISLSHTPAIEPGHYVAPFCPMGTIAYVASILSKGNYVNGSVVSLDPRPSRSAILFDTSKVTYPLQKDHWSLA